MTTLPPNLLDSKPKPQQRRIKPTPPVDNVECKILIVGEAPGQKEEELGKPFVGASGKELTHMLHEAGIARGECYLTNVFLERPENNDIKKFCTKKKEADRLWQEAGNEGKYPHKFLSSGNYVKPEYLEELERLRQEILAVSPNIIIALGNTPLWALAGQSGITKFRGTIVEIELEGKSFKLLPTYHPAYILRKYDDRPVAVADLMKAKRESEFPELRKVKRELWIEPTLQDIRKFIEEIIRPAEAISADIETAYGQITAVGFGTPTHAISIPFLDKRKENWSYWEHDWQEVAAWQMIKEVLEMPVTKIGQNFIYDMTWLWVKMGITPRGNIEDTMLLHHSMYPEMSKGLGFLGSIYTNETAWKNMAPKSKMAEKKDE